MRYTARLKDPKNPKRTMNFSFAAKSQKEAQRLLRRYVPGLVNSNPQERVYVVVDTSTGAWIGDPFRASSKEAKKIARERIRKAVGQQGRGAHASYYRLKTFGGRTVKL